MPGTVLGGSETAVNKMEKIKPHAFVELCGGKKTSKAVKSHSKMCNEEKQMSDTAWDRMLF